MQLAILAIFLAAQNDTGEQFYKFPKDSVWKLSGFLDDKDKKETVTITVTGEADGKVTATMSARTDADKPSDMIWYVADGVFYWAEKKGGKLVDAIGLYKLGSKKGDTWSLPAAGSNPEQAGTNLGTEEVKVPAGTYKDVVHSRIEMGKGPGSFKIDVYLAPKVGVIKLVYSAGEKVMPLELEEFKPAK